MHVYLQMPKDDSFPLVLPERQFQVTIMDRNEVEKNIFYVYGSRAHGKSGTRIVIYQSDLGFNEETISYHVVKFALFQAE